MNVTPLTNPITYKKSSPANRVALAFKGKTDEINPKDWISSMPVKFVKEFLYEEDKTGRTVPFDLARFAKYCRCDSKYQPEIKLNRAAELYKEAIKGESSKSPRNSSTMFRYELSQKLGETYKELINRTNKDYQGKILDLREEVMNPTYVHPKDPRYSRILGAKYFTAAKLSELAGDKAEAKRLYQRAKRPLEMAINSKPDSKAALKMISEIVKTSI